MTAQTLKPGDKVLYRRNASAKYENDFEGTVLEILQQSVKVLLRNKAGKETIKCLRGEHLQKLGEKT